MVLPLLPATTASGSAKRPRQALAASPKASPESVTTIWVMAASTLRSTMAHTAPASAAPTTKSCPSKRSPESATKTFPAFTVRVSVEKPS